MSTCTSTPQHATVSRRLNEYLFSLQQYEAALDMETNCYMLEVEHCALQSEYYNLSEGERKQTYLPERPREWIDTDSRYDNDFEWW